MLIVLILIGVLAGYLLGGIAGVALGAPIGLLIGWVKRLNDRVAALEAGEAAAERIRAPAPAIPEADNVPEERPATSEPPTPDASPGLRAQSSGWRRRGALSHRLLGVRPVRPAACGRGVRLSADLHHRGRNAVGTAGLPLGFIFTFGIGSLWGYQGYQAEHFATTEPFLVLFVLMYALIPVLFSWRLRDRWQRASVTWH